MIITKNIENLIAECVEYSDIDNILYVNNNIARNYINNNNLSDDNIIIVEKIVKLLNNNRQLSNLEISELIKKVNL